MLLQSYRKFPFCPLPFDFENIGSHFADVSALALWLGPRMRCSRCVLGAVTKCCQGMSARQSQCLHGTTCNHYLSNGSGWPLSMPATIQLFCHCLSASGLAEQKLTFPPAALMEPCFASVSRKVLITYQCFGYC